MTTTEQLSLLWHAANDGELDTADTARIKGTYAIIGSKTFRLKSTPVYNQSQFYQTLSRVHRNCNQTKTMNEKNLLPFDLDVAIKHPERVYHTASARQDITHVALLTTGSIAFHTADGTGYVYTKETARRFIRLLSVSEMYPWTRETIPDRALEFVYRKKTEPVCVMTMRCIDRGCVWFGSHFVYYQDLFDQWEWATNINGVWHPCGYPK